MITLCLDVNSNTLQIEAFLINKDRFNLNSTDLWAKKIPVE